MSWRPPAARFLASSPAPIVLATLVSCASCASRDARGSDGRREATETAREPVVVCPAGPTERGIDVSMFQGAIDWPTVKGAGIAFAYVRVANGTTIDPTFAANWSGARDAGVLRGAYLFFEPDQDPIDQANLVIDQVGALGAGDLPVVADVEVTRGQSPAAIADALRTWVDAVAAGTGRAPIVYTAPAWWDGSVRSASFGDQPLWIASWDVSCPTLPGGWGDWLFWQHSDVGAVDGIATDVDLDVFNGDLASLLLYARVAAPPPGAPGAPGDPGDPGDAGDPDDSADAASDAPLADAVGLADEATPTDACAGEGASCPAPVDAAADGRLDAVDDGGVEAEDGEAGERDAQGYPDGEAGPEPAPSSPAPCSDGAAGERAAAADLAARSTEAPPSGGAGACTVGRGRESGGAAPSSLAPLAWTSAVAVLAAARHRRRRG